jgi:hypothetical protein
VSRTVTRMREVWVWSEPKAVVVVGINVLASPAAEVKERPIRITELSSSSSLREDLVGRWEPPRFSPSSSESVRYESISRNSARIFEFLILVPVSHRIDEALGGNERVHPNPREATIRDDINLDILRLLFLLAFFE